jgi:7,8-dihydropterin-6-yl-methyl-4-(beta-D-ribofuranosyl)aminobenzene 5'-phosphate synthase
LEQQSVKIVRQSCFRQMPRSSLLITGEIPRNTSFERGFPFQYAEKPHNGDDDEKNMNLVPDRLVKDDQAIVENIRNEGLVIITGGRACRNYKYD